MNIILSLVLLFSLSFSLFIYSANTNETDLCACCNSEDDEEFYILEQGEKEPTAKSKTPERLSELWWVCKMSILINYCCCCSD